MSFFNVNINNRIVELLPPDKRYQNNVTFLDSLMTPIQWLIDLFFKSYYEGVNSLYVAGTYNYLDQVVYFGRVYSSNIDNNTDIPTTSNWTLVQDDAVGANERVLYTNQKLVFEYALNKRFGSVFTPPYSSTVSYPIYIENLYPDFHQFWVGETEPFSSLVGKTLSSEFIGETSNTGTGTTLTVHIPSSVLSDYGQETIEGYINKLIPIGMNYTITSY